MSIRDAVRKYLDDNPEVFKEMVQGFITKQPGFVWRMIEGEAPKEIRLGNPDGSPLGEPSDAIKELTDKLNQLHGNTS